MLTEMDLSSGAHLLDPSTLPNLGPSDPFSPDPITPTKLSRKRKHSVYSHQDPDISDDDTKHDLLLDDFSSRRSRPPGTKRACNQCRQQKLKCNVVESPWADCDRCTKHNLRCEITADFKRVGKRSQQAELEKNNRQLAEQVQSLTRELASYKNRDPDLELYKPYNQRAMIDRDQALTPSMQNMLPQDDESHDAALLLNLKQGHDLSGSGTRASPVAPQRKLGSVYLPPDVLQSLWDEFFRNYHVFLPVLDPETDSQDVIFGRSQVLFWTVILIASRHYSDDPTIVEQLIGPYKELIKNTIAKPPNSHHVVKALCLLCYWPLPVSTTTAEMSFTLSGILMKFAMQLGLHRPSHPMDFSRTRVQLREEDINDRLKTWAVCNLVAQNVSTGYGQPPDTVYDSTLNSLHATGKHAHLHTRLEIEKLADKITRTIYSPQQHGLGDIDENSTQVKAAIVAQDLHNLNAVADIDTALNHVYASAVGLHLRLFVFFEKPESQRYQLNLNDLYNSAISFIRAATSCGIDLRFAPYYLMQMILAAAVALLKLLHSFFAEFVDREAGERLFWEAISAIRHTSVRTNDLPQRLAEVFAQMWKADTERSENEYASDRTKGSDLPGSTMTLKRRYRMSMSHVFDSIWRWKDDFQGKVRAEKLEAAVQNPTSPHAISHRNSFSNNGRRSSAIMDENATLPGMSYNGFGGLTLSGSGDMAYANSYEFFDPVGWYLDGLFDPGLEFQ